MTPLHPSLTVFLGRDETPESFCSRSSLLLGRSTRDFSLDMGRPFQEIVDGKAEALEALAWRTRSNFEQLAANSITKTGERRYSFRGQALVRDSLSRKTLRVCPRCLIRDMDEQDGAPGTRPFGRALWLLGSVRTCPEHGMGFVTVAEDDHPQRIHDFAALVQPALLDLEHFEASAPRRNSSAFERHIIARCEARVPADVPFLHILPLYAAMKACEVIGAITTQGIRFRVDHLSDDQWYESGTAGFEIVSGGEGAIRTFLSGLQERFTSTKSAWGPRQVFGRLYEWLAHESADAAYDPLRDIIQRHVIETMPIGPGETIFGREVEVRRLHSVRSASLETGAHPKRLRKLLHVKGYINDEMMMRTDERIMFDAAETKEFLEKVSGAMSLRKAGEYLNAPRPHERLLFDAGFIQPLVRGGTETLADHAFARQDLDAFLRQLNANAPEVDGDQGAEGLLRIPEAAKRACCSAMEIVRLILNRKLAKVRRRTDIAGYLSVLVDPEEVKPFVQGQANGRLSLPQAERRLQTSTRVLKALIKGGYLPSHIEINPVNRCPRQVVREDDLDAFMTRYISLHVAAEEKGIHFRKLGDMLSAANIKPAFDPTAIHATFYDQKILLSAFWDVNDEGSEPTNPVCR